MGSYGYKRQLELSVKDDRYRSAKIKIRIIERKTELEACGLVPSGLIKPHTKTLACEDQDGYAGAENGNQEKASAFKDFVDGLFGTKQEKKESGAEEKAAEKGTEPPAGKTEEKSFSQADMDAAIEKAKQDWEAQAEEAKRQAKLSPEEKAAEEQKKKDDQIADLQAKLLKSDLQKKATASLEKDGYPVGLADLLDYTSEEAMEKSLSKLTETFKGSLQAAVESRLRGKTPAGLGNAASAENMLRDQIARNIRGL